jgi:hypothetical protein
MALLTQLGQRSRLVNSTSQSRQHHASESRIGPGTAIVSDGIGSHMVHPPEVISGEAGGAVTPRAGVQLASLAKSHVHASGRGTPLAVCPAEIWAKAA